MWGKVPCFCMITSYLDCTRVSNQVTCQLQCPDVGDFYHLFCRRPSLFVCPTESPHAKEACGEKDNVFENIFIQILNINVHNIE